MFERFANKMTAFTGSSSAFIISCTIIIVWGVSGPLFDFSETWQLVINTGTTIITFLMVFLIQKTQNKDSKAIQLKLNELLATSEKASNRMVDIEDLNEDELDKLHKFYQKISQLAEKEDDIHQSHSIDAAEMLHREKRIKKHGKASGGELTAGTNPGSNDLKANPIKKVKSGNRPPKNTSGKNDAE